MRTLVLDNSFYPVTIIDWQKAISLIVTGRAIVIQEYEGRLIRSVRETFGLPKILKLINNFKRHIEVKFSRFNIYWRDDWTCQYCLSTPPKDQLTFDHVVPRSKGGMTSWENVVTCCRKCNTKKGNLYLKEAGMKLYKRPTRPKWVPQMHLRIQKEDPKDWTNWIPEKIYKAS